MKRTEIITLLKNSKKYIGREVSVMGWVRAFRNTMFIALNDGSASGSLQCVINTEILPVEIIKKISNGAALSVKGKLIESAGKGQPVELEVKELTVLGESDGETYPVQPKKHSFEFLREVAHLRPRTGTFGAVMRIRSAAAYAIHRYFNAKGFYYFNAPIITGSDAEGAGEMFKVTNLDLKNPPRHRDGSVDYSHDFFERETNLTVSGQLEAEAYAMALGKVYTFGPTFRAENSNTSRHLAEFWMVEPEVAFADLDDDMDLAEDFIKSVIAHVMEQCKEDLALLDDRFNKEQGQKPAEQREEMGLLEKLGFVVKNDFKRISYTEAIDILKGSKPNKKGQFKYPVTHWGIDLQSEHERYLVEKHFKCPVILFDYPADIKAFYMRLSEDGKTVRAMDVLFPGIGEIVGGSQREERLDVLTERMKKMGVDEKTLWWYLDLRKFGTAPHSGFGLGFERLVQFLTGMGNIRDVIPFPRYPGSAEF